MRRFDFEGEEYAVFVIALHPPVESKGLTRAERKVADLLVRGWTYAQIAHDEKKSVSTVGKQAARVYKKLAVGSRFELARVLGESLGTLT